jgi:ABC-type multidrug transport system ATPase subunit
MSAVAVEGVWKFYGDYAALREVQVAAAPGSCLALIGRNGAGKTTLLRIVAGFRGPAAAKSPSSARAARDRNPPANRLHRTRISVYDELSALENLLLFGKPTGPHPLKAALHWLERTGLERVRTAYARFSGMRQRLAWRAPFCTSPSPAPEPSRRSTTGRLRCSNPAAAGPGGWKTIVVSTHQLREALTATHVALLNRGG